MYLKRHASRMTPQKLEKLQNRPLKAKLLIWRSSELSKEVYSLGLHSTNAVKPFFRVMKYGELRFVPINKRRYFLSLLTPIPEKDERDFIRSPSGTWYAQSANDRLDDSHFGSQRNKLRRFQQHTSVNPVVDKSQRIDRELIIRKLRDMKYSQMNLFGTTLTHDVSPQLEATIGEIVDSLNSLTAKLDFKDQVQAIGTSIELPKNMSTLLKLLPLYVCVLAYVCTNKGSLVFKGTLCTVGFVMLSSITPSDLWEQLKERVYTLFSKVEKEDNVLQSQMSQMNLKDIVSILFTVTTFASVKAAGTGKKVDKFMSSITDLPKKQDGLEHTIVWILSIIERIINFVRVDVLETFPIHIMEEANTEISTWVNKIESLSLESHKGTLFINTINADRVFSLVSEGNALMSKLGNHREAFAIRSTIMTYQNALKKLQVPFDQANISGNDLRMSPICVLLRGASGVGKSTITVPLILQALGKVLPIEQLSDFGLNHMDFIYNRQPEHVFWDGYRGQFCTIFDDFGQARDVVGTPDNEFMNLIRCGNSFPNTLHMAEINSKGVNNFRSKFVFCSTNMRNFQPASIIEPEAVMRRFDLIIDVVPKEAYSLPDFSSDPWTRRLDRSKVSSALDTNIYDFLVYSFRENRYIATLQYDQIVNSVVEKFHARTNEYDNYRQQIGQIKLDLASQRATAQGGFPDSQQIESDELTLDDLPDVSDEVEEELYIPQTTLAIADLILYETGVHLSSLIKLFPRIFKNLREPREILHAIRKLAQLPDLSIRVLQGSKVDNTILSRFYLTISSLKSVLIRNVTDLKRRIEEFVSANPIVKYVGIMLVVIGCISAAFKIVASLMNSPKSIEPVVVIEQKISDVSAEAYAPRKQGNRVQRRVQIKTQPQAATNPISEGGADKVCDQLIDKISSRNVYEVHTPSSVGKVGYVTFVVGRLFIMPKHFVLSMKISNDLGYYPDDPMITLKSLVSKIEHKIPLQVFLDGKECTKTSGQDIVMCEAPKNVNPHYDITQNFLSKVYCTMSRDYFTKLVVVREQNLTEYCSHARPVSCLEITSPDEIFSITNGYQCDAPTAVGDCGSLLYLVDSSNSVGKIIGSHSAGDNQRRAYSTAIFQEDIMFGLSQFAKQVSSQMEEDRFEQLQELPATGSFIPLFRHDLVVRQPTKNKVIPSHLCNLWGDTKFSPSALTRVETEDGTFLYPMDVALKVYAGNCEYLNQGILDACGSHYLAYFLSNSDFQLVHRPMVYSFDVAVVGQPGVDYCESISRGTSAGFPWCVTVGRSHKGKTFFFGSDGEFDLTSDGANLIRTEVESIIADAKLGRRQLHIYTDNLKDEKRKIEKVALAKTRLFSGCPLGLQIATRMYFLDFSMAVMRNKIDNGIAVGINVYSDEWEYLAKKLKSKGEHVIAGDFSGYDGSLHPQVLNVILELINNWYDDGEENKLVRTVLWAEVFASRHINGNKVYEWTHSLPSGHVLTVIINSIYDHIAFRFAWIVAHGLDCLSLSSYDENVYCIAYGDDNVLNITDYAISFFNQETMPHLLQPLGLIYTNELKNGVASVSRHLNEVSFLKRTWRFENSIDRHIAPLALESILEMPYWTKDGPMFDTITKGNVDKCVEELALHDRTTFDYWFPRIYRASKEVLGHLPSFDNYTLLQQKCLSTQEMY